jgi:hypothetical protein
MEGLVTGYNLDGICDRMETSKKISGITCTANRCICVIATKCNKSATFASMSLSWLMPIMKKNFILSVWYIQEVYAGELILHSFYLARMVCQWICELSGEQIFGLNVNAWNDNTWYC